VPITEPTTCILSEQGAEMGRPGKLRAEVDLDGKVITTVRVGGQVVPVAEGVVRF
jgi:predicted PhzF superfamily epimerase YddE/YHI9